MIFKIWSNKGTNSSRAQNGPAHPFITISNPPAPSTILCAKTSSLASLKSDPDIHPFRCRTHWSRSGHQRELSREGQDLFYELGGSLSSTPFLSRQDLQSNSHRAYNLTSPKTNDLLHTSSFVTALLGNNLYYIIGLRLAYSWLFLTLCSNFSHWFLSCIEYTFLSLECIIGWILKR